MKLCAAKVVVVCSTTNQDNCFDSGAGDGEAKVFIPLEAEKNFHQVLLRRGRPATLEDFLPLVDDLLQDAVDGVTNALEVPPHAGEEAEDARETGEEVRDREAGAVDEAVLDGRHEVFGLAALHAERRPGDDAVCQPVDLLAQVQRRRRSGRPDVVDQAPHLVLPDVLVGADAVVAEDLLDAQPSELPEVVAGGGAEEEVRRAVGHDVAGHELGPGGEDGVVGLEHLAGDLLGGDHHHGHVRPTRRYMSGPCTLARSRIVRCGSAFTSRCALPISGPGGRRGRGLRRWTTATANADTTRAVHMYTRSSSMAEIMMC